MIEKIEGKLPPHLMRNWMEIDRLARLECGLTYPPIYWVMTDFNRLNEVTSYSGMPKRFMHWKFGMEQKRMEKLQDYGFSEIYELVINTNPVIAYLLEYNPEVIQNMVMSHVTGHADFFTNNAYFASTNRQMHEVMANHAERIKFYQKKKSIGEKAVEEFIEVCFSLENLIDYYSCIYDSRPLVDDDEKKKNKAKKQKSCCAGGGCGKGACGSGGCDDDCNDEDAEYKLRTRKDYMDGFINPEEFKEHMRKLQAREREIKENRFPSIPQRDILRFIIKHGEGMKDWERDILGMMREEFYYFIPQRRTKIMNEGWAVYWHREIMEKHNIVGNDFVHYGRVNSGVLATAPGRINPYYIGYEIWKDIKDRWDKGKHGDAYERETDLQKKENWDTKEMKGLEKIFETRKIMDDVEFIRTFFTDEFIQDHEFYYYELDDWENWYKIRSRENDLIRRKMIEPLINCGEPMIEVVDGNFQNSKELLMRHSVIEGTVLEKRKRNKTLRNLFRVWGRPVHILTREKGEDLIVGFDGNEITRIKLRGGS